MKKILFILFCYLSSSFVFSQDYIFTLENEEIKVKVLEVKTDVVTYKKFNNLDGPTFEIAKNDIHKIKFKNGDEEFFNLLQTDGITGINFIFFINDTLFINQITSNSPAANSSLEVGDKIIRINKTRVGNFKNPEKAQSLLNGAPNSTVQIEVVKVNTNKTAVYNIQRKRVEDFISNTPSSTNNHSVSNNNSSNNNNNSQDNTENTTTVNDVRNGFFGSFTIGPGGASFPRLDGFAMHYEFEIGGVSIKRNMLNSVKFMIMNYVEDEINLFSIKYSGVGYFGKYTKQGFFFGGDLGICIYPDGDIPLWDLALVTGYSFRLHRNVRLEIPGSLNLLPTATFSNVAIGGYIGVRISGIM